MKELSIFIDESGDFGELKEKPSYYLVTMVFHEQNENIDDEIRKLDASIKESGFEIDYIHTGPVIRREAYFENYSLDERRKLLYKILNFYNRCPICHDTAIVNRKDAPDKISLSGKLAKEINKMIARHQDYFGSFDKIIVYTEYVVKIYAKGLSNEEIKKVTDGVELVDSETDSSIEWEDLSEPNYSFLAELDDVCVIPDDNILWDTGDNLLNINTKNVSINILDYHFEDSVPDDPDHPGKVYTALKNGYSNSAFDDNGNVTDHYVYLVVHVMVQNNHDSEYEYLANSLSVRFGYSANDPEHYMNELLYSSAQQSEHPVTHLHYMFEANEVYEAYYYFTVERESFEDDSKLCMLLSDEDGAWGYDKDDYIVVLNKSK